MRLPRTLLLLSIISLASGMMAAHAQQAAPAAPAPQAAPAQPDAQAAPADPSAADTQGEGDLTVDDIPDIKVEELNADLAKKAIDGFVLQHEKYQDAPMSDYDSPEEFVQKDPKGKAFEDELKGLGFKDVADWDTAVMSITVAYNMVLNDQTSDIKQQMDDFKARKDLSQQDKDEAVRRLQNQIPSENNLKVINDLMKDKVYGDKVKLFESSEE